MLSLYPVEVELSLYETLDVSAEYDDSVVELAKYLAFELSLVMAVDNGDSVLSGYVPLVNSVLSLLNSVVDSNSGSVPYGEVSSVVSRLTLVSSVDLVSNPVELKSSTVEEVKSGSSVDVWEKSVGSLLDDPG